ncbi:MAG: hypothetical protein AAGI34_15120 [Pseudomonadota bacterium]
MMLLNFANLGGGRGRAAKPKAMEDDTEAMEDDDTALDEEEAQAGGEDTEAMGDEDDDMAMEEEQAGGGKDARKGAKSADWRAGHKAGARSERQRCAAIFAAATPETLEMAANLAFNSNMSAAAAKAVLASAPKGSSLGARMKGKDPTPAASGGGEGGSEHEKIAARILANAGITLNRGKD